MAICLPVEFVCSKVSERWFKLFLFLLELEFGRLIKLSFVGDISEEDDNNLIEDDVNGEFVVK